MNFQGNFIEEHKEQFQKIIDNYEVECLYLHPSKKDKLKNKKSRTCRYCNQSFPLVTFNKVAHSVPELMGNQNLVSDFECDSCNLFFSKYEDALAKFLGISRTLTKAKGKEGIPTFKNPDKKLEARKNDETKGVLISFEGLDEEYFEIDETKRKLTIKATRHPYKPLYVYKCLLKVAFGLLNGNVLPNYEDCRKLLLSDDYDTQLNGHPYLRLFGYFSPGPQFPSPMIMLWKKKEDKSYLNIPKRTMVIHFQNYVYQIFLPFGLEDNDINQEGKTIKFDLIPPFLDKKWVELFGKPTVMNIDLSDCELKRSDKQNITMTFNEAIFKGFPNQNTTAKG